MTATDGWALHEASKLTGLTRPQLKYLDQQGLVKPQRIGNPKKTVILYNWSDLIVLRAIKRLREKCSLQTLREALNKLKPANSDISISDVHMRLIASENKVYWIHDDANEAYKILIQITGKDCGQIVASFSTDELLREIWEAGESEKIVDFQARAKARPQDKAA